MNPVAKTLPAALTIAGFDPSSGAGVTADLKVFAAHNIYGIAAITALTVQSTQGVQRIEPVEIEILSQSLQYLAEDIDIAGVKVGMLAAKASVAAICDFFSNSDIPASKIVVDPVIRSSSGHQLLSPEGVELLKSRLLPLAGWITPNLDELAILAGHPAAGRESIPDLAAELAAKYPALNIVVTGGDLDSPDDYLRTADGQTRWFHGERVDTNSTHGTGCAFSSALLARLIAGDPPADAVLAAKTYVIGAMKAVQQIGKGRGPLHHLYMLG